MFRNATTFSKTTTLLLLTSGSLALSSCAFKKDSGNKSGEEKPTQVVLEQVQGDRLRKEDFKFEALPASEELNDYIIRVSWPANKKATISHVKHGASDFYYGEEANSFGVPCIGGKDASIQISAQASGETTKSTEFTIALRCPKDFLVQGRQLFDHTEYNDFGRVVFEDKSELDLNGHTLDIKIRNLIVKGVATIVSNAQNTGASYDPAVHNQSIKIIAHEAFGTLKVILDGHRGRDGKSGDELVLAGQGSPQFLAMLKLDRKGKKGSQGISGCLPSADTPRWPGFRNICTCIAPPSNGSSGLDGEVGHPGEDGGDGGPTPAFHIEVLTPPTTRFLNVQIRRNPGSWGKGGNGGSPIPPGEGGEPGEPVIYCPHAEKGPSGKPGSIGPRGKDGKPGTYGLVTHNEHVRLQVNLDEPEPTLIRTNDQR